MILLNNLCVWSDSLKAYKIVITLRRDYIQKMFNKHTAYKKWIVNLILTATFVCTLFGNGLHLHFVFNHLFDHGDIYAYFHVHPSSSNHDLSPKFDDKDAHQHLTATVDLTGTLTQKTSNKAFTERNILSAFTESPGITEITEQNQELLDLPPPDFINSPEDFPSLYLRAPPRG